MFETEIGRGRQARPKKSIRIVVHREIEEVLLLPPHDRRLVEDRLRVRCFEPNRPLRRKTGGTASPGYTKEERSKKKAGSHRTSVHGWHVGKGADRIFSKKTWSKAVNSCGVVGPMSRPEWASENWCPVSWAATTRRTKVRSILSPGHRSRYHDEVHAPQSRSPRPRDRVARRTRSGDFAWRHSGDRSFRER